MSANKTETINPSSYEHKTTGRKFGEAAFEGFATFLFMCTIFFSRGDVKVFVFGFWVILSIFGGITGAHVNPAITVGFYFTEQDWTFGLMKMGLYFLFQFTGCIVGVLLGYPFLQNNGQMFFIGTGKETLGEAFFAEFFFTGTFFFVIAVVTHAKYPTSNIAPINTALIISWFYMAATVGGPLSGSAFNPAVLLAINVTASFTRGKAALREVPYMLLGEITGVIVFALIYKYIYCPFLEHIKEENTKEYEDFTPVKTKIIEA